MRTYNFLSPKHLHEKHFQIFMLGILIVSSFFIQLSFLNNFSGVYIGSDNFSLNISDQASEKEIIYHNLALNTSKIIDIAENHYIDSVRVDFNEINETRDFVKNGDLESGADQWEASNETDINYRWLSDGPSENKCIGLNISALDSEIKFRPMRNGYGIENFTDLDNWSSHVNQSTGFTIQKSLTDSKSYPADNTGSLEVRYNGNVGTIGYANSSFQFYYDNKFPIVSTNLSFWYDNYFEYLPPPDNNSMQIGVFLITPSRIVELWQKNFIDGAQVYDFTQVSLSGFSNFFNESGYYNLTFYSIHIHDQSNYETRINWDFIELNITHGVKILPKNQSIVWNQAIRYERDTFDYAILNFSYYISEKFDNINKSKVFLSAEINNQIFKIDPITFISNNTWIKDSITIEKDFLQNKDINLSLGLSFNETSHIFQNESFAVFFDNISLVASNHPPPDLINLQIYEKLINNTFTVTGTQHNESYVVISEPDFIWEAGEIIQLNFTGNSSSVRFDCTLSYTLYEIEQDEGDNDKSDDEGREYVNTTYLFFTLLLIITVSTAIFLIRYQKRSFISPKYDYIKKLRVRKKDLLRTEATKESSSKKICSTCGKPINYRAKFCEHCGSPQ